MWKEYLQTICTQLQQISDSCYDSHVDYIITLSLTLLGIGVSLFALTSAFIVSKKDSLKELQRDANLNGYSNSLAKRMKSDSNFINTMRLSTSLTFFIIVISSLSFVAVNIFKFINSNPWVLLLYILVIIAFVYLIRILVLLYKWYK